jgi:F0F1-type ATP synthase assembly protein I
MQSQPSDSHDGPDESRRPTDTRERTAQLRRKYMAPGGPKPMSLAGAGLELCGAVLVLTLGGWWLDAKWGSSPWLMIGGLIVGTTGGLYNLWRRGSRFFKS